MATIDDVIAYAQDQVTATMAESGQFINELGQAISWEATWKAGDSGLKDPSSLSNNESIRPNFSLLPPPTIIVPPRADIEAYNSELLTTARGMLLSDLQNGGYGLDPRDEESLWNRAREREMQSSAASYLEFQRAIASRGFKVPSGAMIAGMQKIQQEARGKVSSINRDIAIKRADLYVQARQFAITTGLGVEQFLANYYTTFATREMEYIKLLVEANGISVRSWETIRSAEIKEAEFYLDRWAKGTQAYLEGAKIRISELNGMSANEHNISVEGITAADKAISFYKDIATAANNSLSAIATLAG